MRWRVAGLFVCVALLAGCRTETNPPHIEPTPEVKHHPPYADAGQYAGGDLELLMKLDHDIGAWNKAHEAFNYDDSERIAGDLRRTVNQHLDFLLHVLGSHDLEARMIAASALGFSGDRGTVPALVGAIGDENNDVRRNALYSLGLLGSKETPMDSLLVPLHDQNADVRAAAAFAIGGTVSVGNDRGSYASLVEAVGDEEPRVQNEAVRALGVIGRPDVVPLLIQKTLHSPNYLVRLNTATVLAVLKAPTSIEPLIETLMDQDPRVQKMAAFALEKITGEGYGNDLPRWRSWWKDNKEKYFPIEEPQPGAQPQPAQPQPQPLPPK